MPRASSRHEDLRCHPATASATGCVVDANGQTLGRLATQIANALRGKSKPEYTPHVDTGDFVVVVNAEKISVTGNKRAEKKYYRHSGYPGGLKERTLEEMLERRPEEVIRMAVKGMLPATAWPASSSRSSRSTPARTTPTWRRSRTDGDQFLMSDDADARRRDPRGQRRWPRRRGPGGRAEPKRPPRTTPPVEDAPAEEATPAAEAPPRRRRAEEARRRGRGPLPRRAPGARRGRGPPPAPAKPEAAADADEGDDEPDAARQARRSPAPTSRSTSSARARTRSAPTARTRGRGEEDEPAAEGDEDDARRAADRRREIDLAAGARYRATGKRKTAVARVTLQPGTGAYTINGKPLDDFFPRDTLQRTIRQPLETVGYEDRMDVVARMHGGGVRAQAGALRHGISRALLEADPNLRGELKRRGFLTRDARAKERKKAGLKKARKRPQFSKR